MKIENFLTKVKPGTLAIVVIVIAIGVYLIFKSSKKTDAQSIIDGLNPNLSKLSKDTAALDLDTSQIFDALNAAFPDGSTVVTIMQSLGTKDDFNYIVTKFGVKNFLWTGTGDFLAEWFGTPENLIGWFHEQLSSSELSDIQTELNRLGIAVTL
jgi:hypothetical protein